MICDKQNKPFNSFGKHELLKFSFDGAYLMLFTDAIFDKRVTSLIILLKVKLCLSVVFLQYHRCDDRLPVMTDDLLISHLDTKTTDDLIEVGHSSYLFIYLCMFII